MKSEQETNQQRINTQNEVEYLRDFIENAPMPLHWVNGSGIIIWANQAELDLLGYSKDEYINNHISTFHLDQEVIDDIMNRLVNKETLKDVPARLICKNGGIKYVLINSNVYWKNNEFIHTRCFTKDITEIVKEKEKILLRIKEQEAKIAELNERLNIYFIEREKADD